MDKNLEVVTQLLQTKAAQIRLSILDAIYAAGKGHIGGAFSIVDILVSLFYDNKLKFDASDPQSSDRDRFILSKGHAGIALYAVLADLGFFSAEEMQFVNKGRLLGEHPDPRIPGVETVGGSLGHGLSFGAGVALAAKMDGEKRRHVVLVGDGECYEGSVWEAAMFSGHQKLSNLCVIVDRNGLITHGPTEGFNKLEPFSSKWEAFGWEVVEIDGHDYEQLDLAWRRFINADRNSPLAIIAKTLKGKGVPFMEDKAEWHHGGIDDFKYVEARKALRQ